MEFSSLLDRIEAEPIDDAPSRAPSKLAELDVMLADAGVADLVMFKVTPQAEAEIAEIAEFVDDVEAPIKTSRFANAGIDDDLLPIHTRGRRFHR
jgi:hypothetical protein